jgi:hypothetical protein
MNSGSGHQIQRVRASKTDQTTNESVGLSPDEADEPDRASQSGQSESLMRSTGTQHTSFGRALPFAGLVLERRFFIYRRRGNFLPAPPAGLLDVLRR